MIVGANIPWFDGCYGHDLGRNQAYPHFPVSFDSESAAELLTSLAAHRIRHVRIWLFENREGLIYDEDGLVEGLDSSFIENLSQLVSILHKNDIEVYWTLLDANSIHRNNDHITRSILVNPEATTRYIQNCMLPVCRIIERVTWGIDLCNEPEALIYHSKLVGADYNTEWSQTVSAFEAMLDAFDKHFPQFAIGIGSGYYEGSAWAELIRPRLGRRLKIVDYHSHRPGVDVSLIDPRPSSSQKLVLGEIGFGGVDHDSSRMEWHEAQRKMLQKLRRVSTLNAEIAFVWYATALNSERLSSLFFRGEAGLVLHSTSEFAIEEPDSHSFIPTTSHTDENLSKVKLPLHLRQMGGAGSCAHRSGWRYALEQIENEACGSELVFDDFVERTFQRDDNEQVWTVPWAGIVHHPPNFPAWLDETARLDRIFSSERFSSSLPHLRALFSLSEYLTTYLEDRFDVPVITLKHPTELPAQKFDPVSFASESRRQVVQVGHFGKNLRAIYQLRCSNEFKKIHLFNDQSWVREALARTDQYSPYKDRGFFGNVEVIDRLSNDRYDELLSRSIVLCELFDASASNTIIEAIARNTPIIVNRHPAAVEYLGEDYPLLFDDFSEVGDLIESGSVESAHDYLKAKDKSFLSGEAFGQKITKALEEYS